MRWSTATIALVVFFLFGCAAEKSPFQASWFLVEGSPPKAGAKKTSAEMYLAILNQSPDKQQISEVILNQIGDDKSTGYPVYGSASLLVPGQIRIWSITEFGLETNKGQCRVPVRVLINTAGSNSGSTRADMIGTMPSSLPADWEADCTPK